MLEGRNLQNLNILLNKIKNMTDETPVVPTEETPVETPEATPENVEATEETTTQAE